MGGANTQGELDTELGRIQAVFYVSLEMWKETKIGLNADGWIALNRNTVRGIRLQSLEMVELPRRNEVWERISATPLERCTDASN